METIKFKSLSENFTLPEYATEGSANFDLRARFDSKLNGVPVPVKLMIEGDRKQYFLELPENSKEVVIYPGQWAIIPLGFSVELPNDKKMEIYSRSGLAANEGLVILNSPGQIDSDYRGCVCAILINHGRKSKVVKDGERICQAAIVNVHKHEFELVDELSETDRADGGLGHSGTK